jgi:hypothetical protein
LVGGQGGGGAAASNGGCPGGRGVLLARLTDLRRDQWQWCCCVVHARCCLHAHPQPHPCCPQCRHLTLSLSFAGTMSGHCCLCAKPSCFGTLDLLTHGLAYSSHDSAAHTVRQMSQRCGRLHECQYWQSHGHSTTQHTIHPRHHQYSSKSGQQPSKKSLGEGGGLHEVRARDGRPPRGFSSNCPRQCSAPWGFARL